ncbi:MAG: hypothetical protein QNJ44_17830 [Rhodobacter sp.]|nr:hypothetical protein [Rhodobacter sp.]
MIGAGSYAEARTALRLAERLAGTLATDLGGMLVEETIWADLAGLPKQRVITSSGTFIVAPSRRQIKTVAESDAKAFRQTLSALAPQENWSFERRRGELISGLCEAAKGWDLLLLGYRETHRLVGQIVLIEPPADAEQEARVLADDLAHALGTGTLAMTLGSAPQGGGVGPPDTEHFSSEDLLLARIARLHASAVVLDLSAGPLRTYDQLRRLFAAARCPIVVVGAGRGEPSLEHSSQIPPAPEAAT